MLSRTGFFCSVFLAMALSACGGGSASSGAAGAVRGVVVSYVRAIDEHDGGALCGMFDHVVVAHFERLGQLVGERTGSRRLSCRRLVGGFIGYVGDSGVPEWKGVSLTGPPWVSLNGRWAVATFYVTHRIDNDGRRTPLVEADALPLVRQGGRWRLASSGRTLGIASSGGLFEDRAAASGWRMLHSPGQVAREYVTSLSGGPPGVCALLGKADSTGGACWEPRIDSKILPLPGKSAWQAAQIDAMTTSVSGKRAVVKLALTETYLSSRNTLFTRALNDRLSERLTAAGWRPASPSTLYFHARGLPVPRRPAGPVLPQGRTLASHGALDVWAGGNGAALFTESRSGDFVKLRDVLFRSGSVVGENTLTTVKRQPAYATASTTAFAGTAAAGDLGHGRALVAWSTLSNASGVNVQEINAHGKPLGPIRHYAIPRHSPRGSDQEATSPGLSYNPHLRRYLLVWNEGYGTEGRGRALVLNEQGLPAGHTEAVQGLDNASSAPTARGWLATSHTSIRSPIVVALDAAGRPFSKRILRGGAEAILASGAGSDLIAWSTESFRLGEPVRVLVQRLTDQGQPVGREIQLTSRRGSRQHPIYLLGAELTGTDTGYIAAWGGANDTFDYRRLNVDGKPTSPAHSYKFPTTRGFPPATIASPALTLTPDGNDAWLWLLGQITGTASVVPIR